MAVAGDTNRYWDLQSDPNNGSNMVEVEGLDAFFGAIENLFRTKVGDRGAMHRPEWGNHLYLMLQEPINAMSANRIKTYLLEDVRRCLPLVKMDMGNTNVIPVLAGKSPGYVVTLAILSAPLITGPFKFTFTAVPS